MADEAHPLAFLSLPTLADGLQPGYRLTLDLRERLANPQDDQMRMSRVVDGRSADFDASGLVRNDRRIRSGAPESQ
jgi:hypothetical protein